MLIRVILLLALATTALACLGGLDQETEEYPTEVEGEEEGYVEEEVEGEEYGGEDPAGDEGGEGVTEYPDYPTDAPPVTPHFHIHSVTSVVDVRHFKDNCGLEAEEPAERPEKLEGGPAAPGPTEAPEPPTTTMAAYEAGDIAPDHGDYPGLPYPPKEEEEGPGLDGEEGEGGPKPPVGPRWNPRQWPSEARPKLTGWQRGPTQSREGGRNVYRVAKASKQALIQYVQKTNCIKLSKTKLIPNLIRFMEVTKFVELDWSSLAKTFPAEAYNSMDDRLLQALPWEDILPLMPAHIVSDLSPETLVYIPPSAWEKLPLTTIRAVNPSKLAQVPVHSLRKIPSRTFIGLGCEKLGAFSDSKLRALDLGATVTDCAMAAEREAARAAGPEGEESPSAPIEETPAQEEVRRRRLRLQRLRASRTRN